jgi:hypothetical protein
VTPGAPQCQGAEARDRPSTPSSSAGGGRRFPLAGLCLGLALSAVGPAAAPATTPGDFPLVVTPARADLGVIRPGSRHDLVFAIANRGRTGIRLWYMYAECDCHLSLPDKGLVPAGGEYVLRVQLRAADDEVGPIEETVFILTDWPSQPELRIPVVATAVETANQAGTADGEGLR